MPVIDHAVSHQPNMPQRGAAKDPVSLNWGSRRRELERITSENRGIVGRIQGRSSYYPAAQWGERSEQHDKHLLLIRRPQTSVPPALPAATPPASPALSLSAGRSRRSRRNPRRRDVSLTQLLATAKVGDAHLVVGLLAGLSSGTPLVISPQSPDEEHCVVYSVVLRNDGLVVMLREPVKTPHSEGTTIIIDHEGVMSR